MKTLGWLVECEGRSLFMRQKEDILWALEDQNYKVTPLVAGDVYDSFIVETPVPVLPVTDDTTERLQILEELYELEEEQISNLKTRLEEAVELVEDIYQFASKQTNNIMESRGLLLLIGEACNKWLKPRQ